MYTGQIISKTSNIPQTKAKQDKNKQQKQQQQKHKKQQQQQKTTAAFDNRLRR